MKILEREIFFNFLDKEAFTNIQQAKTAFISNPPSVTGSLIMMLLVLALIIYGINRSKRP